MTEDESRAVRNLREILREAPSVAETLLGFPWLDDGVTEDESYAIYHLRETLREDHTVAETLMEFHWLDDGVTGAERDAIYGLRVVLREDPATAETLLGFPWFADGVTENESRAVYDLQEIWQKDTAAAESVFGFQWLADGVTVDEAEAITHLRRAEEAVPGLAERMLELSWIQDTITTAEAHAIHGIGGAARLNPELAEKMLQKPWVQDGITRDEGIIIRRLYWLAGRTDEATQQSMADIAISIIDMPFLDEVSFAEALAVMSLDYLTSSDTQESFRAVMSHLKVQDGITDQEAKVIAVLLTPARHEPEMIPHLLAGMDGTGGVYLEERTIQLPLTGETLLTIVRTQDQTTASMGYLEHAVRFNEKFMDAPLPTNYVALYFGPNTRQTYAAHNWNTHMAMGSDRDGPERKANVFAHEVGHYYFKDTSARWIHEGAAEIITFVSEYERAGYPLETHLNPPCDYINTLPESDPDEHKLCSYYIGGSFFIDLYRTLREDAFLQGFRALYRMRLVDTPGDDCFECTKLNVHHVLDAFTSNVSEDIAAKAEEVLVKWYGPLP